MPIFLARPRKVWATLFFVEVYLVALSSCMFCLIIISFGCLLSLKILEHLPIMVLKTLIFSDFIHFFFALHYLVTDEHINKHEIFVIEILGALLFVVIATEPSFLFGKTG